MAAVGSGSLSQFLGDSGLSAIESALPKVGGGLLSAFQTLLESAVLLDDGGPSPAQGKPAACY